MVRRVEARRTSIRFRVLGRFVHNPFGDERPPQVRQDRLSNALISGFGPVGRASPPEITLEAVLVLNGFDTASSGVRKVRTAPAVSRLDYPDTPCLTEIRPDFVLH